jgi:hypothetical protein
MTLSVLIVVRRLEGAHGFAHQRKVTRQRTNRENERLFRVTPRFAWVTVFSIEKGGKAATAGHGIPALQGHDVPSAAGKIND